VIGRLLRDRTRATPERIAIEYDGREISYAELDAGASAFACSFAEAGLKRGDRVATLTGNSPEHVQVLFACVQLGLILLPLSWRLAAPELRYQLDDAEPSLFLVEDEYIGLARETGYRFERLAEPCPGVRHPDVAVEDDDPLLLIYTSGTTGKPKGALLTHANCFWTNFGFDLATGVHGDDVVLQVLPQFHVGGWNVQALLAWWKGARVILEREFDAARALRLIEEKRVTTMMGVPPIYLLLAREPGFDAADLSSLERAVVGGAPMPEALLETWAARGTAVVQGYGLTEAAPNVLCVPPEDAVRKLGCAGKPYPFVDVRLSAENELQVRGPNVFPGYWRNPEATAEAFTSDGWLRTGDVAECDDEGFYRIKGRLKEMYISGGENVYPAEVEAVLHAHPQVLDAAVVGVPDERWGEVGIAFVVSAGVAEDELSEWCRARLARFKVPKSFRLIGEIPRNTMGKVQKQELRATGVAS
jgi:fatty-acyl-CoA synthase